MKAQFSEVGPMSDSLWRPVVLFLDLFICWEYLYVVESSIWGFWVCLRRTVQHVGSSSLLFRHHLLSDSLQTHGLQHARPPCPSPFPRICPGSWIGDAIWPSHPLSSPSPYSVSLFQHQGLFRVGCLHQLAKVLEPPDQGWNPCSLLWKHVVLTIGLPGKSQQSFGLIFLKKYI